jgi:surface polysaccharide O-acyltransferase-like enzyme
MNNRILYLSRLKALACIAVTVLHTFLAANMFSQNAGSQGAMMAVRNCMMWAVPCFVMASGALLLDSKRALTMKKLFGKYVLRMALALVIFSILFAVFDGVLLNKSSVSEICKSSFNAIFLGTGWMHMWYIYLLFALYLLLPVYKLVSGNAPPELIKYMLAVYAVFTSLIPFIETLSGKKLPFYICIYTIYPLYFFLGHALHTGIIKLPKRACGLMFVICLGITAMMTFYAYNNLKASPDASGKMISMLGVYSFPIYIATALSAFGFCRKTKNQSIPVIDKIAAELDNCSFGIYLIHMAVLRYIFLYLKFNPFEHGGTITIIGICIATVIVSYAITKLLKFVPYVNKLI